FPWSTDFTLNETITLTAVANEGFVFSHWSGASRSTDAEIIIIANANNNYVANFLPYGSLGETLFSVYTNPAFTHIYIQVDAIFFFSFIPIRIPATFIFRMIIHFLDRFITFMI